MRLDATCSIPLGATPMQLKEREVVAAEQQAKEVEQLRSELQSIEHRFEDYVKRQAEQREADSMQAEVDKKEQRRHELKLAAFTVCLTLFLEHIPDVIDFLQVAVEYLIAFFE